MNSLTDPERMEETRPICKHKNRNEAMECIFYRAEKSEQTGGYHGPNHFEQERVN